MKALRLTRPVSVTGRSYWGKSSQITFAPTPTPAHRGWYWQAEPDIEPIPMSALIVESKQRRMRLAFRGCALKIVEHISPLRLTGLDGVIVESDTWPPYHGRTWELWEALKPNCQPCCYSIPWVKIDQRYQTSYPRNPDRVTRLEPFHSDSLAIRVRVDYPDIGNYQIWRIFPDLPYLEQVFQARSQGWPKWLYHPSRMLPSFSLRPSHEAITWPQEHEPKETARLFAMHRALDFIGALMLAYHDSFVAGIAKSERSGHRADVELLRQISN